MSGTGNLHRPLLSGIKITSRMGSPISHRYVGEGTLTGLATRNSDRKKMLVTNLHVMAAAGVDVDRTFVLLSSVRADDVLKLNQEKGE